MTKDQSKNKDASLHKKEKLVDSKPSNEELEHVLNDYKERKKLLVPKGVCSESWTLKNENRKGIASAN